MNEPLIMKPHIPILILATAFPLQIVSAGNLSDVSPFRIDIETNSVENYKYAFLDGSDDVAFHLSPHESGEAYYLGIDTSGQFAAEITGLAPNYPSFVRGGDGRDVRDNRQQLEFWQ